MHADVGVVIGRFQVDKLHEGHIALIGTVVKNHPKVIIFLGLTPLKCTIKNPLDFECRKQMILQRFPDVIVLYIKDQPTDKLWSTNLDEQINDIVGPNKSVALYGSRDSFISHYCGKYNCIELEAITQKTGTMIRDGLSKGVIASSDFRAGIVWATQNRWINAIPVVDVAIMNEEKTKVLLGRKPYAHKFQFIGGFVDVGETYETAAEREAREETTLEVDKMRYIGSCVINDWRYRGEVDKLTTTFFLTYKIFGHEKASDDISELKWFELGGIEAYMIEEHQPLIKMLKGYLHHG